MTEQHFIVIDSFGGKIGNIRWQNTWNELWGHTGFWDKNPEEKGRFTLWGIRPKLYTGGIAQ
jgi:hypothetical protein